MVVPPPGVTLLVEVAVMRAMTVVMVATFTASTALVIIIYIPFVCIATVRVVSRESFGIFVRPGVPLKIFV